MQIGSIVEITYPPGDNTWYIIHSKMQRHREKVYGCTEFLIKSIPNGPTFMKESDCLRVIMEEPTRLFELLYL